MTEGEQMIANQERQLGIQEKTAEVAARLVSAQEKMEAAATSERQGERLVMMAHTIKHSHSQELIDKAVEALRKLTHDAIDA